VKQQWQQPDQLLLCRTELAQNPFQACSMKLKKPIPDNAEVLAADTVLKGDFSAG
jgi:hypothetical protein